MKTVGMNIKRIIQEKGFKTSFVAEKTGYNQTVFSRMINGKRGIEDKDILKLSQFLGVLPNEFFKTESDNPETES